MKVVDLELLDRARVWTAPPCPALLFDSFVMACTSTVVAMPLGSIGKVR